LSEVKSEAAHCPPQYLPSSVSGDPPEKTIINASPDRGWPEVAGEARLAVDATVSDQEGDSDRSVGCYLARGQILLGVYFDGTSLAAPVAGQSTVEGVVEVFERRLAALPSATVG
jgi:hypothetical protein